MKVNESRMRRMNEMPEKNNPQWPLCPLQSYPEADKPKGCPILLMDQTLQWLITCLANVPDTNWSELHWIPPIQTIGPLQEFLYHHPPISTLPFLSWEEFALLAMKTSRQASVVFIPASPGWSHQDRSSTHIIPHFWKQPFLLWSEALHHFSTVPWV